MRTMILAIAASALLAGCGKSPIEKLGTDNPEFSVDLLFKRDGCRVYRFTDNGRFQYFANCPNHTTTISQQAESCGKSRCPRQQQVDTAYGMEYR